MTNLRMVFAENLRAKRLALQLSQEELAALCGLHRTYISDIERGTRNLSIDNVERIAEALKVEPADLMRRPS